jgi:cell division septal protein FtsQ
MNNRRTPRTRARQKQINILHTNTKQRHSQKQVMQMVGWVGLVLAMVLSISVSLHFGINFVLSHVLYSNPRYNLTRIEIEPRGHFTDRLIRQQTGLEPGENLWTLDLRQITRDVEKMPNVASAKIERRFPDTVAIAITERVPAVKIYALNADLPTKELYYLDRDGVVLKPRPDENVPFLPEIIGLTDADADLTPGMTIDQPQLKCAMEILYAIDHTKLHTSIDIQTIDLSNPLSISMVTRQQMTITFRLDSIDQQLVRLQQAMAYSESIQRTLQTIDLTPDQNDPITFCQNQ